MRCPGGYDDRRGSGRDRIVGSGPVYDVCDIGDVFGFW